MNVHFETDEINRRSQNRYFLFRPTFLLQPLILKTLDKLFTRVASPVSLF